MNRFYIFMMLFSILFVSFATADDGLSQTFDNTEMDINDDNYVLFEDGALIIGDRDNDQYLMEITRDNKLFVNGKRIKLTSSQKRITQRYYELFSELFTFRNRIGAKGLKIGMSGVKLAAKAVSGAFVVLASGGDEVVTEEFEEDMEREAERLEAEAEKIEDWAEDYELCVDRLNRFYRRNKTEIAAIDHIDLYVDTDSDNININRD